MLTKTQAAREEINQLIRLRSARIKELGVAEFPIGAKVKWIHTYKHSIGSDSSPVWRRGTVKEHATTYAVVMMSTGNKHEVDYDRLYPDADKEGA